MPYFFILPAYMALLIGLIGAATIAHLVPRFRSASGYIFAGAIGSLVGFIVINVLVWVIGLLPLWLGQKDSLPVWLNNVSKFFVVGTLLIGPFVGSAMGVLLGFAAGFYCVFRRRRNAP